MRRKLKPARRLAMPALPICLAIAASAGSIHAQTTVTNFSVADAMLLPAAFTNTNRGAQPEMYLGDAGTGGSTATQPIFQFSLANIPAGQTIVSATLRLELTGTTQVSASGHRVLVSWIEGDGATGLNSGTSGVTWDRRDKAGSLANWTVPGAAGVGSDRAAASFTLTTGDVTSGIVLKDVTSDVTGWYTGSFPNFGWLLDATFVSGQFTRYFTREQVGTSGDPQLIITYVPEPSSALLLLGLSGLLLWRRRR
jgi:hypothetical protein